MWNRRSRFTDAAGLLAVLFAVSTPSRAHAQACCAGGTVITPGRLAMHEDALVGLQEKAGNVVGSYGLGGRFVPQASGDSELDFEQDLFGALRVLPRGQLALLAPLVETRRATPQGTTFFGGLGDVNLSARYDFVVAGESRVVPGVALLAGLTMPTGNTTPARATGIGAYQINAALALEQNWGPWLVNATAIVAQRTDFGGETLGTQVTLLGAGAYTFDNDAAVGLSASYAFEGDATSGGSDVPDSFKRVTTVTLSGLWPVTDSWRLLGGLYLNPPLTSLGANQLSVVGITYTLIRSWT